MRKILAFTFLVLCSALSWSQTDGMSYQAVVIGPAISEIPGADIGDNVLQNADITVRFTITDDEGITEYQEMHTTITDSEGMFHLKIGQGTALSGVYTEILWYGNPKNLKVEIDIGEGLVDFEDKPIVFTPHAFHRDILATGDMSVDGDSKFESDFELDGTLLLNNTLEVANEAATDLTGTLAVDGVTSLNADVLVTNGVITDLSGALSVGGMTNLNDELHVNNASATSLDGDLKVAKNAFFDNALTVTQAAEIDSVFTETMLVESDQNEYVAQYENLNGADADGIAIKLGRTHGAWNGSSYLNVQNPINTLTDPFIDVVKNWLNGGSFKIAEIIKAMPNNLKLEAQLTIMNAEIKLINSIIGLPKEVPPVPVVTPAVNLLPETTFFSGMSGCTPQACFKICFFGGCSRWCVPPWRVCANVPRLYIPSVDLPAITLIPKLFEFPAIPEIPTQNLFSFSMPTFSATSVSNSLTSENEYMTFADKDGRKTGAIKAGSVVDFRDNTILDNVYILNVVAGFVGVDLLDGFVSGTVELTNLMDTYNHIGVEYSSGNGDYAEWLERADHNEYLTAGDIIAVKGGKISKDLSNAEQLMVVSHKPIVLGNLPEADKAYLGNTIAFMGQVPVKVIGPVASGDYIVADDVFSGYGKAIHPDNMRSKDHSRAVGRSWENHPNEGPKMVNTVVGVQNGDWMNSTKKLEKKQHLLTTKIQDLEATLDRIALKMEITSPQKRNYVNNK